MDSTYSCIAAGKTRFAPKTQSSVSYEHLDRDFIASSRQDAADQRRSQSRSPSLPKIATGRSIHSAKTLWADYECVEVKRKVQRENEKPPEVPPIRVPKNPHSLYKHTVKNMKPFHILHGPSDYGQVGQTKHQLGELYAQVTYLSNAVRNCDGSASYRGMCKRQRSYSNNRDDPNHPHWRSSDENIPVPRLLLPVLPGTNTKWYSWKVDTPHGEGSPHGREGVKGRGGDKRHASSAPVSRSLDFIQQYGKAAHHVTFTVDEEGGRRSRNKEGDTKSRDGRRSIRTDNTESLTSSSLSSIMKSYDPDRFKLKDCEGVSGTAVFLTQPEMVKMTNVEQVHADVPRKEKSEEKSREDVESRKDDNTGTDGDDDAGNHHNQKVQTEVTENKTDEARDEDGIHGDNSHDNLEDVKPDERTSALHDDIKEEERDTVGELEDETDVVARANMVEAELPQAPEETRNTVQDGNAVTNNTEFENHDFEDRSESRHSPGQQVLLKDQILGESPEIVVDASHGEDQDDEVTTKIESEKLDSDDTNKDDMRISKNNTPVGMVTQDVTSDGNQIENHNLEENDRNSEHDNETSIKPSGDCEETPQSLLPMENLEEFEDNGEGEEKDISKR